MKVKIELEIDTNDPKDLNTIEEILQWLNQIKEQLELD